MWFSLQVTKWKDNICCQKTFNMSSGTLMIVCKLHKDHKRVYQNDREPKYIHRNDSLTTYGTAIQILVIFGFSDLYMFYFPLMYMLSSDIKCISSSVQVTYFFSQEVAWLQVNVCIVTHITSHPINMSFILKTKLKCQDFELFW